MAVTRAFCCDALCILLRGTCMDLIATKSRTDYLVEAKVDAETTEG